MNQRALVVALLGLATTLTACHKKPPAVAPTPETTQTVQPPPPPPPTNTAPPPATSQPNSAAENAAKAAASLAAMIHFDYDLADIKPDDRATLDGKAAIMRRNPNVRIRITGHCDERGSDEYNIALGMKRATAAKDYLVRAGIDASRIEVASLGREVPLDPASNEAAWAKNRRDEFEITAGGQNLMLP